METFYSQWTILWYSHLKYSDYKGVMNKKDKKSSAELIKGVKVLGLIKIAVSDHSKTHKLNK